MNRWIISEKGKTTDEKQLINRLHKTEMSFTKQKTELNQKKRKKKQNESPLLGT